MVPSNNSQHEDIKIGGEIAYILRNVMKYTENTLTADTQTFPVV